MSTHSTEIPEPTRLATTSAKTITLASQEKGSDKLASRSTTSTIRTTDSSAPERKVEQETTASEGHSSIASDTSSTITLTAVHTGDHSSEQVLGEAVATSTSNGPEAIATRPTRLLIQKANAYANSESPFTTPVEDAVPDAQTAPPSTLASDMPASPELHSAASESPASGSPASSLPTEVEIPTTLPAGASSEPTFKAAAFERKDATSTISSTEEPTRSSTASSEPLAADTSASTGDEEEVVTTSSPAASQAIFSTESPESMEHTFTFVLPDFYDHEQMNVSDEDHHFNYSDWASLGAGVETEGSNEMFDDACAYLQHRVEYLFKMNVSKLEIQKLISQLKVHEVQEEAIPALHKNLTECVASWEESTDKEPSAVCVLLKNTIADVCKRVDSCNEEEFMKTAFEHLKHLLTTDSLHDAIVMGDKVFTTESIDAILM
ncbi:unnamed protein product [Schistocephalus solidus]|uniref:Flocculation protein FLO11-like n=1 Tax=Schistocephalus solidus TaxID=70667 RepID=A0A183SJC3_SCHSO|nr:unnamed protein product [Schistocephalus solidus]